MSVGLRVVRGPDWKFGNKDGGEGHIGTVISVKDDNTAEVVWDNGTQVTCKIGKDGKKDLRVIDNAPAGNYENTVFRINEDTLTMQKTECTHLNIKLASEYIHTHTNEPLTLIDFWCLTPRSAIFQLYHGDQF
jgi:E3 ubiquitin-protein ligase mind-bomb